MLLFFFSLHTLFSTLFSPLSTLHYPLSTLYSLLFRYEDVTLLAGQMECGAIVGRANPSSSLSLLIDGIQTRCRGLASLRTGAPLTSDHFGDMVTNPASTLSVTLQSHVLLDHLWWYLHFLGHLLVDANVGESPTMPQELADLSSRTSLLQHSGSDDLVVSSIETVLILFEQECSRVETYASGGAPPDERDGSMSPLLHTKILWFLRRWCRAYLMPDPSLYSSGLPPTLQANYGASTERGVAVVGRILSRSTLLLCYWSDEPGVARSVLDLLKTICSHSEMRRAVVSHSSFTVLLRSYSLSVCPSLASTNNGVTNTHSTVSPMVTWMRKGVTNLSQEFVGSLSRVICLACDASPTPEALAQNLMHAAAPAFTRLGQITTDQASDHRSASVRQEISRLLRILRGIAEATSMTNMTSIFDMCVPTLSGITSLLDVYHHEDQEIVFGCLDYLTHLVEGQIIHLDPLRSRALYSCVGTLLSSYSRHGLFSSWLDLSRPAMDGSVVVEQDMIAEEILMVLRIMSQFANKKLVDWYDVVDDASQRAAEEGECFCSLLLFLFLVHFLSFFL